MKILLITSLVQVIDRRPDKVRKGRNPCNAMLHCIATDIGPSIRRKQCRATLIGQVNMQDKIRKLPEGPWKTQAKGFVAGEGRR